MRERGGGLGHWGPGILCGMEPWASPSLARRLPGLQPCRTGPTPRPPSPGSTAHERHPTPPDRSLCL